MDDIPESLRNYLEEIEQQVDFFLFFFKMLISFLITLCLFYFFNLKKKKKIHIYRDECSIHLREQAEALQNLLVSASKSVFLFSVSLFFPLLFQYLSFRK